MKRTFVFKKIFYILYYNFIFFIFRMNEKMYFEEVLKSHVFSDSDDSVEYFWEDIENLSLE